MKNYIKFLKVLSFIILLSFAFSCTSRMEASLKNITELEKQYGSEVFHDTSKANNLLREYHEFAAKYPKDTATARFLFEAGRLEMYKGKGEESIAYFNRLISDFPDYKKIPDCMFLKGFVYDDILNDILRAKSAYNDFIKKFPKHEFADDAKSCLDNLGKTPEQLIKEFEAKNKKDSVQVK